MRTGDVSDLRSKSAQLSGWLQDGETVTITKRGRPFATLAPVRHQKPVPTVDRMARLRRLFPDGPVKGHVQAVIAYDRRDT